ncbi:MAG: hypothetical protein R2750_08225, partial [Bacteroidales bacterium]
FIPYKKQVKYKEALNYVATTCDVQICGCPVNPTMELESFRTAGFLYHAFDKSKNPILNTMDPNHKPVESLHHVFDLKFKSSTGNLVSLINVGTREHIKFRVQPGGPPFNNHLSDTPQEFFHGVSISGANTGYGRDDHMTKPPGLICHDPLVPGELIADQWYQYTIDQGANWENIPGAAYNIIKGVRKSAGKWVFYFIKRNWALHNKTPFHFEAEYMINKPSPPMNPYKKLGRCSQASKAHIKSYAHRVVSMK